MSLSLFKLPTGASAGRGRCSLACRRDVARLFLPNWVASAGSRSPAITVALLPVTRSSDGPRLQVEYQLDLVSLPEQSESIKTARPRDKLEKGKPLHPPFVHSRRSRHLGSEDQHWRVKALGGDRSGHGGPSHVTAACNTAELVCDSKAVSSGRDYLKPYNRQTRFRQKRFTSFQAISIIWKVFGKSHFFLW